MFLKVRLKNFRSFSDIEFDLTRKQKAFKHFAVIYGENGMGKSNLTYGIAALIDLMRTMDVRDVIESLFANETFQKLTKALGEQSDIPLDSSLGIQNIQELIHKYRMADSTGPVVLEYEFLIAGKKGKYLVELGDSEIIHERLEYVLERNRGVYFDLSPSKMKINVNIFKNTEVLRNVQSLIDRFWGKHSLLAILLHEKNDKSERYINNGLSDRFHTLMHQFTYLSCSVKVGSGERRVVNNRLELLRNLESGRISKAREKYLDITEHALSHVFGAINSDNRALRYKRTMMSDDRIQYELYIYKYIAGQVREIEFSQESTGNHQLLKILPLLLTAMVGGTVIIDEVEMGIHDLLMKKILGEIIPHLQGQLIVTSHNTMLMEIENIHASVYIITEDNMANKEIRCIDDYQERIFQQNNIRKKYLEGQYEGVPMVDSIDFSALLEILQLSRNNDE